MIGVRDLAARLDLKRSGRGWRGMCPACGYDGGAFVLAASRTGKLLAWCASCQDRDAIARAIGRDALSYPVSDEPARRPTEKEKKRGRALSLWYCSVSAVGTPAATYLSRRGLTDLASSPTLRFCAECPHPEGGKFLAMVALVTDTSGASLAVHRTFITRDGRKASVEPTKASLGPVWGGVIRLHPLAADKPLVIGEGIESSASAGRVMGLPAWAAIASGNLAKGLQLPPEAGRVVIAADADRAGRETARNAWLRWKAEGREVRVATPNQDTCDFNDILLAWEAAHA
jgi:putative DNA primase/helicase